MAYDWHVGQQVVCIDVNWVGEPTKQEYPRLGGIYTIQEIIEPWPQYDYFYPSPVNDDIAFRFYEVRSIGSFYHWHFRPVKKTDISEFLKLTKPVDAPKKRVLEDA